MNMSTNTLSETTPCLENGIHSSEDNDHVVSNSTSEELNGDGKENANEQSSPSPQSEEKVVESDQTKELDDKYMVKLYMSVEDPSDWKDCGIGYLRITDRDTVPHFSVKSEDESSELLYSRVYADDIYQIQQSTLIVWNEPTEGSDDGVDLALSFPESSGCIEVWNIIREIQKSMNGFYHPLSEVDEISENESEGEAHELIPVTISNLKAIKDSLAINLRYPYIAKRIKSEKYIEQLCDLFKKLEDLEDDTHLYELSDIFRLLISRNYDGLLSILFSDDIIMTLIGALEYDSEQGTNLKHRDFLKNSVTFKSVIPLPEETVSLINQTYKIQYIKDVILGKIIDDSSLIKLNQIISRKNNAIVMRILSPGTIDSVMEKLQSSTSTEDEKIDILGFLNELFSLSKHIDKRTFFSTLAHVQFYDALFELIIDASPRIRLLTAGLLVKGSTEFNTTYSGTFVLNNPSMLDRIIETLLNDNEPRIKMYLSDVLLNLLDGREFLYTDQESSFEQLLNIFYSNCAAKLFKPLADLKPEDTSFKEVESLLYHKLIELLGHFINNHGDFMKNILLSNSKILKNTLHLLRNSDKQLVLDAIKLVKTCTGKILTAYRQLVIDHGLLVPILKLYAENSQSQNLINSAILDLFQFIKNLNSKPYIKHFGEDLYPIVSKIEDVFIFSNMYSTYKDYKLDEDMKGELEKENQKFQQELEESSYFEMDEDDESSELFSRKSDKRDRDINADDEATKKQKFN